MMIELPVRSDLEEYDFVMELERVNYLFRFHYNRRMARWVMSIARTDGSDIVAGVPLLSSVHLLLRFRTRELPPGRFQVHDETGAQRSPELSDLGETIQVLYVEAGAA